MQFNITLNNNVATVDSSNEKVDPIDALNKLKKAASIQFNVKTDIDHVATSLKTLAHTQIGSWTKFWDAIGSLFLSCFGYVTTAKKVDTLFKEIISKHKSDEEKKNDQQGSPDSDKSKSLSPKKSKSPVLSPEEIKRRLIEEREKEAKKFVDGLLPDLSKVESYEISDLVKEINAQINGLDSEKKQACCEYLVSLDHFNLAIKFVDELNPESREVLKEKYGLCPEARSILDANPELKECIDKCDFENLSKLINEGREKKKYSESFFKMMEIWTSCLHISKLIKNHSFDEADALIKTIRFNDVKRDLFDALNDEKQKSLRELTSKLFDFYKKNEIQQLDEFINALDDNNKDFAYSTLAEIDNWNDAKKYASKIQDEKIRDVVLRKCELLDAKECEKVLSEVKYADILSDLNKHEFLKALNLLQNVKDYEPSIYHFIAIKGADFYAKNQDYARLIQILKEIRFRDLRKHYQEIADVIPKAVQNRSLFFYELDTSYSIDHAKRIIESEPDANLKAEGYDYLFKACKEFSNVKWVLDSLADPALKQALTVKYGLHNDRELKALPEYPELKRLIKTDRKQAEAYVNSLNSPSLLLYYTKKSIAQLIDLEDYDEAQKLLSSIRFTDIREQYESKIKSAIESKESDLEEFKEKIQECIQEANFRYVFELIDRTKKPSHREAGYVLIATQTVDFEEARKALAKIQNPEVRKKVITTTALMLMEEVRFNELKELKDNLAAFKFNEARTLIAKSSDECLKNSLKRIVDESEIKYLISKNRYNEALRFIEALSYQSLKREYLIKLEMSKSEPKYPNMANALSRKGSAFPGLDFLDKLDKLLGHDDIDSAFKDIQGCDVIYYIRKIINNYEKSHEYEKALSIIFLMPDAFEYSFMDIINVYLVKGDMRGIELAQMLSINNKFHVLKKALKEVYFKDRQFTEKLIKTLPFKLDSIFYDLILDIDNKDNALELVQRINDAHYLELAEHRIGMKFGDLKLFIKRINPYLWIDDFEEFKKNYKPVNYTVEEFKWIEEKLDKALRYDMKIIQKMYELLLQLATNEADKARISEKIRACA